MVPPRLAEHLQLIVVHEVEGLQYWQEIQNVVDFDSAPLIALCGGGLGSGSQRRSRQTSLTELIQTSCVKARRVCGAAGLAGAGHFRAPGALGLINIPRTGSPCVIRFADRIVAPRPCPVSCPGSMDYIGKNIFSRNFSNAGSGKIRLSIV